MIKARRDLSVEAETASVYVCCTHRKPLQGSLLVHFIRAVCHIGVKV